MVKGLNKIFGMLVVIGMVLSSMTLLVTNTGGIEDEEEKDTESLNPDVATDEYIHIVWQENLTSQTEIYYVNDANKNFKGVLESTINTVETLIVKDDVYEDILEELNDALEEYIEEDYKHGTDDVHHAVKDLEKVGNTKLINILVDSMRDFAKTNILYAEYDLTFNNIYIQEAYEKYYLAIDKYDENNYDAAIKQFKNAYLKIVEGYEENDETFVGIDFGKIVRISYTEFDSVDPQIFLNGTISVGWKENMGSEPHVYYARSSNNGKTWWYFDATEYGYNYLSAIGINPYSVNIETTLRVTRALEDIRAVHGCHYIYTPIVKKETGIIDRHYYSPINDPYLELYKDRYEIVPIDGKEFYLICGPGPIPSPPPQMPDLTFRYAYPSKPLPVEGEKITIYANITNQGDATVSGEVNSTFLQKEVMVGNVSVSPPLKPGEGKQIEKEYTVTAGRHVMIQCTADPNNDLTDEGNKDNNIISFPMNIVKEVKTDWGVTDAKRIDDMDICLTANVSVQAGAKLELNDTFLLVNSTTPGQYTINIANSGKVDINSTIIQSENSSIGYKFIVNGEMNLTRSAIGDMWGDKTGMGGVEIYSNASVTDSAIHDGKGSGLYIKDSSPKIANTTILYNKVYDLYLDTNATPTLLNCVFNESKVYFKDTTSKLNIERYMHVKVVDSNDEPVMNATVTVKDNNGVIVYTGLTDYYGYARWIPVPYRTVTKTSDTYLIHTVTAIKDGVSGLKVLEGWEDDLNLSVTGSSASTGKPSVLTVDRNKNTYWEGLAGQSSYSLTLDIEHSIAQGNMSIYYPKGCSDEYNMTVRVHSHSGIGTTGHGLLFDGVNDYVEFAPSESLNFVGNKITVEAWVNTSSLSGEGGCGHQRIVHKYWDGDGHSGSWLLWIDNNWATKAFKFAIRNTDGTKYEVGKENIVEINKWFHIVGTYDGSKLRLYVNGELVAEGNACGNIGSSESVRVGENGWAGSFSGSIDEVRILNRVMGADEIKQDYTNKVYNPTDGVVGWWHFDENTGTTVSDTSGNGNDGTIYGATWTNGVGNGGVREINVVKASTDTVTNVLLSPNPDIIDKVEIIFNSWSNTPKITEITGIGDTVSPELAKTIARERIKLLAKEDYPEWANATVSEPVVYYSSIGEMLSYEMAVLSKNGSVIGEIEISAERRKTPVTNYNGDQPMYMSNENRIFMDQEATLSNKSIGERFIWFYLAGELLFEGKWGSTKYMWYIDNAPGCLGVPHLCQHQAGLPNNGAMYCSPTSGAMILRYWAKYYGYTNLDSSHVSDIDLIKTVAKEMGTSATTGTSTDKMCGGLRSAAYYYHVSSDSGSLNGDHFWMSISYIHGNQPTIENFNNWFGSRKGHSVVGEGYTYKSKQVGWWSGWTFWPHTEYYDYYLYIDDPYKTQDWGYYRGWTSGRGGWYWGWSITYAALSQW